jgi:hypothetical protein
MEVGDEGENFLTGWNEKMTELGSPIGLGSTLGIVAHWQ